MTRQECLQTVQELKENFAPFEDGNDAEFEFKVLEILKSILADYTI